jgi:hypothetical protein
MLMIWSSLARNRSPSLVASCFFGRIDPSDAASNHGSKEEGIPKRNRKVLGSRTAKPCNPKSAQTPKNDPPSTTWPFFTGDYSTCPKGKRDCLVPGCGTIPFNKAVEGFRPYADIVASAGDTMLYERGRGRLRSALDLPSVDD